MVEEQAPIKFRVLNLARGVAGAICVRMLGDLGAGVSVLKWDESFQNHVDFEYTDLFHSILEDGFEVCAEVKKMSDLEEYLPSLANSFDLFVTDFDVSEMEEGRLYDLLSKLNPSVVVANVSHFGRTGPYSRWRGDELTDYALGGYWALAGDADKEPLRVPGQQAQFHGGTQLAFAAIVALRHARLTGQGQEVDVSSAEAMLGAHWSTTIAWTHEGRILQRSGSDLIKARDGWVHFYHLALYDDIFTLFNCVDLLNDSRFESIAARIANIDELVDIAKLWCIDREVMEIVNGAQSLRIPVTPVADVPMLLNDDHLLNRGYFKSVKSATVPGLPWRWDYSWELDRNGNFLEDALSRGELSLEQGPADIQTKNGEVEEAPLEGIRILELTNNWAGPIACRHLADLGAEVIKIELSTKLATRASHYPGIDPGKAHWNRSGYFNEMNRNKRDISLNLATEQGRELFLNLVAQSDVVIENNSARVMPNLGVGYERLKEVNPSIVMASISGFGATGKRRDWLAYGSNIEAACGLASTTGYSDVLPYRTGSFVADPIAGIHAAIGVLAALERRDETGQGAYLDIALTESAMTFMLESFVWFHKKQHSMPRNGNIDHGDAPTGAYPCFGRDEWIAIAVRTDEQWHALTDLAGFEDIRLMNVGERIRNRSVIDHRIKEWVQEFSQFEIVKMLQSVGVPSAPILHNWQLHSDPHFHDRNAFISIEHPDTGVYPYPGFMWRFSKTKPSLRRHAPRFGEANTYVFGTLLGLTDEEIDDLFKAGVSSRQPDVPRPLSLGKGPLIN